MTTYNSKVLSMAKIDNKEMTELAYKICSFNTLAENVMLKKPEESGVVWSFVTCLKKDD